MDKKIEQYIVFLRLKDSKTKPLAEHAFKIGLMHPVEKRHFSINDMENMFGVKDDIICQITKYCLGFDIKVVYKFISVLCIEGTIPNLTKAFGGYGVNKGFKNFIENPDIPPEIKRNIQKIYEPYKKTSYSSINKNRLIDKLHNENFSKDRMSLKKISRIYDFPEELEGRNQNIGIICLGGGYKIEDIEYYLKEIEKVNLPEIKDCSISNIKNDPGKDIFDDIETLMDIQIIATIANKASLAVYFSSNTELGFIMALGNAILDKNNNNIISISWGKAELLWDKSSVEIVNYLLEVAACLGVTICAPSGNYGSSDGIDDGFAHVDFPSSSPYVLSCGGTDLYFDADSNCHKETVWSEEKLGKKFATGGGMSELFDMPHYQSAYGVKIKSLNKRNFNGRCIPDVAAFSGPPGYGIYFNKKLFPVPGGATSSSAPLWAALIALINEGVGRPVGFINPLLYSKSKGRNVLNEIIKGNNDINNIGGYYANHGWNACTGLGTPNGYKLLELFRLDD